MQELDATTRIPSPWTTKPFLDPPCIPAPRTAEPLNSPTPQKPAVPLNQRLYCTILDKVGHAPPPHPPWQRDKTQQLLTNVWSTLNTLFLARQQLELVSTMRRVVSNITTALHQVNGTEWLLNQPWNHKKKVDVTWLIACNSDPVSFGLVRVCTCAYLCVYR